MNIDINKSLNDLLRRITNHPIWGLIQIGAVLIAYIIFYDPIKTWISKLSPAFQTTLVILAVIIIVISIYNKYFNLKVPIYSQRDDFMDGDLITFIQKAKSIKISNISFSIFRHIDNLPDIILKKIDDGGNFEILFTRRQRNKDEEKSYLKIRQEDESNNELIQKTNKTLFELFLFMLNDLYPLITKKIPEINTGNNDQINKDKIKNQRKELFRKFQIKEYPFYPVMCMYIFDDNDIIFGPYIAAECNRIPLFHLKKRVLHFGKLFRSDINGAYRQLDHHYSILSTPTRRHDKSALYLDQFCYYNGIENISIHEFIETNYDKLVDHLREKQLINKYESYLVNNFDNNFNDQPLDNLKNPIEGRFDAVMRDIENAIKTAN
jgi:hypothetical protein